MRDRIVELVRVRAGDLVPNPANWRRHPDHQRAALRALLRQIGYADALLARRDGDSLVLIDGHLRRSLDPEQVVPVQVLDLDEGEAELLLATLDPLASLATPDPDALACLLERVQTSSAAVADLLASLARGAGLPLIGLQRDPDHVPEAPEPVTKPGDLWVLGKHRLLCADGARPSEGEAMVAGDVVNSAARIQSAAPVNGILAGESTYRATRGAIEYRDVEPIVAKGKTEPIAVWEALAPRARVVVERMEGAPLIGRERELSLIQSTLARVKSASEPQLVTLVGVPGIGKSRLVFELFKSIEVGGELVYWRRGRSLPYGEGVAFWALAEMVKLQAGILESDQVESAEEKLHLAVSDLLDDPGDARWVETQLRPLLGLGGDGTSGVRREALLRSDGRGHPDWSEPCELTSAPSIHAGPPGTRRAPAPVRARARAGRGSGGASPSPSRRHGHPPLRQPPVGAREVGALAAVPGRSSSPLERSSSPTAWTGRPASTSSKRVVRPLPRAPGSCLAFRASPHLSAA